MISSVSGTSVESNWLRLSAETEFWKSYYVSGEAEMNRGSDWDSDVIALGAGYRF